MGSVDRRSVASRDSRTSSTTTPPDGGVLDLTRRDLVGLDLTELTGASVPELLEAESHADLVIPIRSRRRRHVVLAARVGVSLVMLGVLYWRLPDFEWSALIPRWTSQTALWLAAALGLTLLAIVLSALRWQQVLHALGLHARLRRLVPLYFAGQFVSNVLPTTVGGDVLRVSRLSKDNGDPADTFASVVLERLSGWLVLPLLTFFGLAVNPGLRDLGRATLLALVIAVGTLASLVAVLVLADHQRVGGRFRTAEGWTRFVGAVHLGIGKLRHHPVAALGVLGAGLAYQFVLCLAALMAAAALGLGDMGLTPLLAFLPAVLIAQVLPIGIAGLGIREAAFVIFLTPLGVPPEQAIALGLMLYLLNLVVSLIGVPSFAVGGRARTTVA
jgi:glycosyltransferase 2 family protein